MRIQYLNADLKTLIPRKTTKSALKAFKDSLKASDSCDELLTMHGRELEDAVIAHVNDLDKQGVSTASIHSTVSAIKNFFVANREENRINWKWLKGELPKNNGKVKDRDYTKDELVKMWIQSDTRKRAILSLLMTGIRKGAIPGLRYGNLVKITNYRDKDRKQHKFESHIYKLTV